MCISFSVVRYLGYDIKIYLVMQAKSLWGLSFFTPLLSHIHALFKYYTYWCDFLKLCLKYTSSSLELLSLLYFKPTLSVALSMAMPSSRSPLTSSLAPPPAKSIFYNAVQKDFLKYQSDHSIACSYVTLVSPTPMGGFTCIIGSLLPQTDDIYE